MRKFPLIVLVAACTLAGSAAAAPYPANLNHIGQFHELAGVYDLSNGKTLRLKKVYNRLYADINGNARQQLSQTGRNTYASQDGTISITYQPQSASADIVMQSGKDVSETLALVPAASLPKLAAR